MAIKKKPPARKSPASHFTLDKHGQIREVNLTGANLLEYPRQYISGRPFKLFLDAESRQVFRTFFARLLGSDKEETCQITLKTRRKTSVFALCKGAASWSHPGQFRLALNDDTERRHAMDELTRSHEQLRDLAVRMEQIREEERARIARDIHDVLGQALTGLKLDIAWVKQQMPEANPALLEKLNAMSRFVDATNQTVRDIATELRPVVLDQLGLIPAMEWCAKEFQSSTGIQCKMNFFLRQVKLDQNRSTAVFRIFQEILTNVARHTEASTVTVTVQEHIGELAIVVTDDGRGITEEERSDPKSLGLASMRQRAALLGGETIVAGVPGKGTTVTVRMPLKSPTGEGELTDLVASLLGHRTLRSIRR